ncbi:MAG: hypothetical protein RIR18_2434 [Pseudomonadota bacterium]
MKRIFLITLSLCLIAGCSSLSGMMTGGKNKASTSTTNTASKSPSKEQRSVYEDSCCDDEAAARQAVDECIPLIQTVKLVTTCESCSAFVVSAKTRRACQP